MYLGAHAFLRSPDGADSLELVAFEQDENWVSEGILRRPDGGWYPIMDGLPVFPSAALTVDLAGFAAKHGLEYDQTQAEDASGQSITNTTFSDKWQRFQNYGFEDSHKAFLQDWYVKKFGLNSREDLPGFIGQFENILEVGPGSGFNSLAMAQHCKGSVCAVDISEAARTTMGNVRAQRNCHAIQADLFHTPFADETFDFVIADGVLHHTPSTKGAMNALFRKVRPGGKFFFYVYRKMGALRVFADEHIREAFMEMEPEDCYAACRPITELGRELSKLNASVTLENPIPELGIPAGTHDVQRLIYYNILKCFWNDAFDFETNNMVNFDWYHPHHAWQQTEEEVTGWLQELNVTEYVINDANPNGISVLLTKPE